MVKISNNINTYNDVNCGDGNLFFSNDFSMIEFAIHFIYNNSFNFSGSTEAK